MGGYRTNCFGRGLALHGDKTTTGATCYGSIPDSTEFGLMILRVGDPTSPCPKCGQTGRIVTGESRVTWYNVSSAVDGSTVLCGCPVGTNRVIAPAGQWIGSGKSPEALAQEKYAAALVARRAERAAEEERLAEERECNRVFAKSCLRGEGCNDAGDQREPHSNFAQMAFFRAAPADVPATDSQAPQRAQAARKKPQAPEDIPKPKKRSALYRWWAGNHEEMDYQAAVAAAAATARVQTATAGASTLELLAGRALTYGTWAARSASVAAGGIGAPVAGLLVGMMPGRLNDGEQDFIDRMRAEQMREAPSRVRFTWESDGKGNLTPHGWHTPPGKDNVRVRKMEWDNARQAYTFTTEEDDPIVIIWTPDSSGVKVPSNTGNQDRPVLPHPVIVDPLPGSSDIKSTASPAPEEKGFADYILILPLPDIPPIYIFLRSKPGQVTGKGQKINGIWLSGANRGNGSPVPSQIVDKLRGRTFSSFDGFREAFWQEVSKDPELSEQFDPGSLATMKNGRSAYVRKAERIGQRAKYELHHIEEIKNGGAVYNVDNLGVVTPKWHIEIHRGKKNDNA